MRFNLARSRGYTSGEVRNIVRLRCVGVSWLLVLFFVLLVMERAELEAAHDAQPILRCAAGKLDATGKREAAGVKRLMICGAPDFSFVPASAQ